MTYLNAYASAAKSGSLVGLLFLATSCAAVNPTASPSPEASPTAATPPVTAPSPEPSASSSASTSPRTPRITYNSVNVDGMYIAITYDDGPHGTLTPRLLDMLKERGIFTLDDAIARSNMVLELRARAHAF